MPLSQTLLIRIFPREKVGAAIGMWSMTTLVAPVVGPILGGWLCDNVSWGWVFLMNAPIAIGFGVVAWQILKRYNEAPLIRPIDKVGLGLLVVWVAALQLLLDEGKNLDWFASDEIRILAAVAALCFAVFLIWELNDPHPIVDLRVFRHRGFSASVVTISLAFAAFFAVNVLVPLWLQSLMGYTATIAGFATAGLGLSALVTAPIVANAANHQDPRKLVFIGVVWMGLVTLYRAFGTTDMAFANVAWPLVIMGLALPFFFIPVTTMALGSVEPHEMDSAAGLMNFLRTLSGAFATSAVTTIWADQATRNHAELVGLADPGGQVFNGMLSSGMTLDAARNGLDGLVSAQSLMLSTNQVTLGLGVMFFIAAAFIWLAPRPQHHIEPGAGGH